MRKIGGNRFRALAQAAIRASRISSSPFPSLGRVGRGASRSSTRRQGIGCPLKKRRRSSAPSMTSAAAGGSCCGGDSGTTSAGINPFVLATRTGATTSVAPEFPREFTSRPSGTVGKTDSEDVSREVVGEATRFFWLVCGVGGAGVSGASRASTEKGFGVAAGGAVPDTPADRPGVRTRCWASPGVAVEAFGSSEGAVFCGAGAVAGLKTVSDAGAPLTSVLLSGIACRGGASGLPPDLDGGAAGAPCVFGIDAMRPVIASGSDEAVSGG